MQSVGSRLDAKRGFGPGFDFMRVALAFGVVLSHSVLLTSPLGKPSVTWWKYWSFADYLIVPMFFALSGFLVTASAMRQPLKPFITNRALRIVPALAVEITLSALVLGPLLTTLDWKAYFTNDEFFRYLLNFCGYIHYVLPGLFENNPFPRTVNGSLYTIPYEIQCYILMSLFIIFNVLNNIVRLSMAICATLVFFVVVSFVAHAAQAGTLPVIYDLLFRFTPRLLGYFVLGALAYVFRHKVPYSTVLFAACLLIFIAISALGLVDRSTGSVPSYVRVLSSPLAVYIVIFIGLSEMPKLPIYSRGDYSYGIYLYGFPIQQSMIYLFPGLGDIRWFLPISLVASTLMAIFSWHVIEKPALKLRKYIITPTNKASIPVASPGETMRQV